jgi:hypothetical protein
MGYSERDLPELRAAAASRSSALDRTYHARSLDDGSHPGAVDRTLGRHPSDTANPTPPSNQTSVPGQVVTASIVIPADVTTPLGEAVHVLHGVADQTAQFYAQLHERQDEFTPDGLVKQRQEYRESPIPQLVDNVRQVAAQRVAQAEQDLAAARQAISPEPTDVLTIAKAEQEWRRVKSVLDTRDEGAVIPAAIRMFQDADPKRLAVLANEFDDYGQSRNLPEFADALLTQIVPEYAAKKDKYRKTIQCEQILNHECGRVENFIATGQLGQPLMPVDVVAKYDPDLD